MDINFTARRFKAHSAIKEYAINEVKRLQKLYDGILRGDIILYYERGVNSLKTAEIILHVYGTTLPAHHSTDDYVKSIDGAMEKLARRLSRYKSKLREKNKTKVRRIQSKV